MAKEYMSMDNLFFTLYDVMGFEELLGRGYFSELDRGSIDLFLKSIKDFSDSELYPVFREMDEQPAIFDGKSIKIHPKMEGILKKSAELGLSCSTFPHEYGGMQLPGSVFVASYFITEAANNNISAYPGLATGAAELILEFGSDELKNYYLPPMVEGRWFGTMCLTEPQAGSSLSDVKTSASPNEDGSYSISGQKIFISAGDHQFGENFVHLVLARIDGAAAGTKGISLFVVPKFRQGTDGSLEDNDVITAGDFQKLGQRGVCTTHLIFGENNNSKGWLVGEPNKGLKYMFLMMNGARIAVGRGGAAIASAAYYASLEYAQERPQGRKIDPTGTKDAETEQVTIINHPDVRRMLLLQKAVAEGSLSLVCQASYYHDKMQVTEGEERETARLLLEMLTPMVKTYPAEMGRVAVSNGLQVLGGYGFCSEYILQQYYRDIRIFSIYEGTTGIQSMDLLGRKMTMKGGAGAQLLAKEITKDIIASMTFDDLKPYADALGAKLGLLTEVFMHLSKYAIKGDYDRFLADATLFMDFMGNIVIGWQWLKMATKAKEALVSGKLNYPASFYESKIHTMKFFFRYELPKTTGLAEILKEDVCLTMVEEKEYIV